jgi:hypothetical protein
MIVTIECITVFSLSGKVSPGSSRPVLNIKLIFQLTIFYYFIQYVPNALKLIYNLQENLVMARGRYGFFLTVSSAEWRRERPPPALPIRVMETTTIQVKTYLGHKK